MSHLGCFDRSRCRLQGETPEGAGGIRGSFAEPCALLAGPSQAWTDFYWDAYDFDKGDWDNGFGWESDCDLRRPLARTFQAIELVNYAAPVDATTTDDFSGDFHITSGGAKITTC